MVRIISTVSFGSTGSFEHLGDTRDSLEDYYTPEAQEVLDPPKPSKVILAGSKVKLKKGL